eukprot:gb/GECG01010801.1/.p1 GENE.gb/GECG01010801.1/~~gb/GECG01010801.1/.p1  ORF type:complete len:1857 (+),score=229.71 gb/GECG01010801.1/:1-5571(+)
MRRQHGAKKRKPQAPQKLQVFSPQEDAAPQDDSPPEYSENHRLSNLALYELRLNSEQLNDDSGSTAGGAAAAAASSAASDSILGYYSSICDDILRNGAPIRRSKKQKRKRPSAREEARNHLLVLCEDNATSLGSERYVVGYIRFNLSGEEREELDTLDDDGTGTLGFKIELARSQRKTLVPTINGDLLDQSHLHWKHSKGESVCNPRPLRDVISKVLWNAETSAIRDPDISVDNLDDLTRLVSLLRSKFISVKCYREGGNFIVGEVTLSPKSFIDDGESTDIVWHTEAIDEAAQKAKGQLLRARRGLVASIIAQTETSAGINSKHPFMQHSIAEDDVYSVASPSYKGISTSSLTLSENHLGKLEKELDTNLRKYQLQAVAWMLGREAGTVTNGNEERIFFEYDSIHPMWRPVRAKKITGYGPEEPVDIFVCRALGLFSRVPVRMPKNGDAHLCGGGILADEMGLGKSLVLLGLVCLNGLRGNRKLEETGISIPLSTLLINGLKTCSLTPSNMTCVCGASADTETQSLAWAQCDQCYSWQSVLLLRPWKDEESGNVANLCVLCAVSRLRIPVSSASTLIICPQSLIEQWRREISKHCSSSVTCKLYPGIHEVLKVIRRNHEKLTKKLNQLCSRIGDCSVEMRSILDACKDPQCSSATTRQLSDMLESNVEVANPGLRGLIRECRQCISHGQEYASLLDPRFLGANDIVLTSYGALSQDLGSTSLLEGEEHFDTTTSGYGREVGPTSRKWTGSLRYKKRYRNPSSPLVRVGWRRVSLDESQMVDSPATQCASMARKLPAIHRWCVSGTPLTRSLDDWHGLCMFLGDMATPWCNGRAFQYHAMKECVENNDPVAICQFLQHASSLMWRNTKTEVSQELALPPCRNEVISVRLSPIEYAFYQQQVQQQLSVVSRILRKWRQHGRGNDSSFLSEKPTRTELHEILDPLVRVRQACCHPQATNSLNLSGKRSRTMSFLRPSESTTTSPVLTMEQTLKEMVRKCLREAEAALREMIAAYNGIGGSLQLLEDPLKALQNYRDAIYYSQRRGKELGLRIDPLQWLHTCHNCNKLLGSIDDSLIEDDTPVQCCKQLWKALSDSEYQGVDSLKTLMDKKCRELELQYLERVSFNFQATFDRLHECSTLEFGRGNGFVEKLPEKLGEITKEQRSHCLVEGRWLPREYSNALIQEFLRERFNIFDEERTRVPLQDFPPMVVSEALENSHYSCSSIETMQGLMRSANETDESMEPSKDALLVLVTGASTRLEENREKCWRALKSCLQPSQQDMQLAANCRVCKNHFGRTGPTCPLCLHLDEIQSFVSEVWTFQSSRISLNDKSRGKQDRERRAARQAEDADDDPQQAVKAALTRRNQDKRTSAPLFKLLSHIASDPSLLPLEQRRQLSRIIKGLQQEAEVCRSLYERQKDLLDALDELDMAKVTLQVVPETYKRKEEDRNLLYRYEVSAKCEEVKQDLAVAEQKLSSQTGRLSYLMRVGREEGLNLDIDTDGNVTVGKASNHADQNANNDCPVCLETLADEKILLPCAHRVCQGCIGMLMCGSPGMSLEDIKRSRAGKCPQCRKRFQKDDLFHIVSSLTGEGADTELITDNGTDVPERGDDAKGDSSSLHATPGERSSQLLPHSVQQYTGTKIASIVSHILKLQRHWPGIKAIVFSQWEVLLRILEQSCKDMEVAAIRATAGNLRYTLPSFQDDPSISVLLLPTSLGNHGLNITEANHVFFVEPPLNKGVEHQAIGRIHRIGQQKECFVHHFIAHRTVEETVLSMVSRTSNVDNSDASSSGQERNDSASASSLAHSVHGRDEVGLTRKDLLNIFDAASHESGYTVSFDEQSASEPASAAAADDTESTELS